MNYPLLSEYIEAIKTAGENFEELKHLRPVLDEEGEPIMSSGNFAVVFKMKDEQTGKLYAMKCFLKEQEGRVEAYRLIAGELGYVSSTFLTPIRYLEKELFVDSNVTNETVFPVLLMDWVEGVTLDKYIRQYIDDQYELSLLAYQFSRLAMWLMSQPFAHGDLKPDNILVREDGTLVLVDYDGMYVPAMKGQKARELGSPDFRHPARTDDDFDEHIDDFSLASILLSLKAISLQPSLLEEYGATDRLLFSEADYRNLTECKVIGSLQQLMCDSEFLRLYSAFFITFSSNITSLSMGNLFKVSDPYPYYWRTRIDKVALDYGDIVHDDVPEWLQDIRETELVEAFVDDYGVKYSKDRRVLLDANCCCDEYFILEGVVEIRTKAFFTSEIATLHIPSSVYVIGYRGLFSFGIKNFECSVDNRSFISENGILYSRDMSRLIAYPQGRHDVSYKMPDQLEYVEKGVFYSFDEMLEMWAAHWHMSSEPDAYENFGFCSFRECDFYEKNLPYQRRPYVIYTKQKCKNLLAPITTNRNLFIDSFGVVYSEDKKTLLYFDPGLRLTEYEIIEGCETIGENAFYSFSYFDPRTEGGKTYSNKLERVILPNSLTNVLPNVFDRCEKLKSIVLKKGQRDFLTQLLPKYINLLHVEGLKEEVGSSAKGAYNDDLPF